MLAHPITSLSHVLLLTLTLLSTSTTALPTSPTDSLTIFTRDDAPISKRALSGLTIKMFKNSGCGGSAVQFGNVPYDTSIVSNGGYNSVQFNGRALLNSEQINTYKTATDDGDRCGFFTGSVGRNSPAGCYSINNFGCFRLVRP